MSSNKISVVFPGQGSQYPQMLAKYIDSHSLVRNTFDESSDLLGMDLIKLLNEGSQEDLSKTEVTQPLMLTADIALWNQISQFINLPACMAGHSLGEYAALVASETISFEDGLALVVERSKLMQSAVPQGEGGIAAIIGLEDKIIEDICNKIEDIVVPANYNCPGQIVISGSNNGVKTACEELKMKGAKRAIELPVSGAFHSPIMESAKVQLEEAIHKQTGEKIEVFGAGRTDAGVHSYGQVAHFDLPKPMSIDSIRDGLNQHLRPQPIAIINVNQVDNNFHARFSAKQRHYIYKIVNII